MSKLSPFPFLNLLKIAKVKFVIQATEPLWLPAYKGSTFRGAFGTTFHRLLCLQPDTECEQCLFKKDCVYHYIFETPNPQTLPAFDSPKVPHPFILEPPEAAKTQFPVGAELSFHLVLIGRAIEYLPYFIYTFDEIGRRGGIGKFRRQELGRFKLTGVFDLFQQDRQIYTGKTKTMEGNLNVLTGELFIAASPRRPETLQINFLTPTRIKHRGKFLMFNNPAPFEFQLLVENFYRRLFYLTFFHCIAFEEQFCLPRTTDVQVASSNLHWHDWERYSNRQQSRMNLGGFIGKIAYAGDVAAWLPLIRLGEIVHLGKASVFGLGRYRVEE